MIMLERWRRRRAIGAYVRRLPRLLRRDYGASAWYTPAQVMRTIERHGLNRVYAPHAAAMFSERAAFFLHYRDSNESYDYDRLRIDIDMSWFGGRLRQEARSLNEDSFHALFDPIDAGHGGGSDDFGHANGDGGHGS